MKTPKRAQADHRRRRRPLLISRLAAHASLIAAGPAADDIFTVGTNPSIAGGRFQPPFPTLFRASMYFPSKS